MSRNHLFAFGCLALIVFATGCDNENERLAKMAQEHAARQAEQSREMLQLQREVSEGAKQLVEADAKARQEMVALQHEVQEERTEVGRQRDRLEGDRREIAAQRHRDPIIAAAILRVGLVLACLLPLLLCVYVLRNARDGQERDEAVTEVLIEEIVAEQPRLLSPPRHPPALPRESVEEDCPDPRSLPDEGDSL